MGPTLFYREELINVPGTAAAACLFTSALTLYNCCVFQVPMSITLLKC